MQTQQNRYKWTRSGRVIYDRDKHSFSDRDTLRIYLSNAASSFKNSDFKFGEKFFYGGEGYPPLRWRAFFLATIAVVSLFQFQRAFPSSTPFGTFLQYSDLTRDRNLPFKIPPGVYDVCTRLLNEKIGEQIIDAFDTLTSVKDLFI